MEEGMDGDGEKEEEVCKIFFFNLCLSTCTYSTITLPISFNFKYGM